MPFYWIAKKVEEESTGPRFVPDIPRSRKQRIPTLREDEAGTLCGPFFSQRSDGRIGRVTSATTLLQCTQCTCMITAGSTHVFMPVGTQKRAHVSMCVCMCVCKCICIYTYIYNTIELSGSLIVCYLLPYSMYVCMYVRMYDTMYVCMYVRMYDTMYVCMYACMHACMHACVYVHCGRVCICLCAHTPVIYMNDVGLRVHVSMPSYKRHVYVCKNSCASSQVLPGNARPNCRSCLQKVCQIF